MQRSSARARLRGALQATGPHLRLAGGAWRALHGAVLAFGRAYRAAIVRSRFAIVVGWVGVAVLLNTVVPTGSHGSGDGLGNLLPPDSHAVQVERKSLSRFRVPVLSETSVVVHDPSGLTALTRADIDIWALSFTQAYLNETTPAGGGHIIAAIPIPTATATTAVTYLYMSAHTSLSQTVAAARQYAAHFHNQSSVTTYITGVTPAQVSQEHYLLARLDLFAIVTLALIGGVVAFTFRSLLAPLVVLGVAAVGYLVVQPLLAMLAAVLGFALPSQLKPLVVALLLGVVTDYFVLFISDLREQLDAGLDTPAAVERTLSRHASTVLIAGLTVAGGTIALLAANLQLFRAFGPALAMTVLIGLVLSLTLVPALMAVLGHHLFRSSPTSSHLASRERAGSRIVAALLAMCASRRSAAVAMGAGVFVLLVCAAPVLNMRLDLSFSSGLPRYDQVQRGAAVLSGSGIRGVTAPTEVLVESSGILAKRVALDRLQAAVAAAPGVAEVLGPAQNPLPDSYGVVFSTDGNTARLVVIFDSDPLGSHAIADLRLLGSRLDSMATAAGLRGATVEVTGQTAIASELAVLTHHNLRITLLAALAVELVILMLYLGALVAPLVLLACSALGVAAALGLTTLVFQGLRGDPGLTFYAPFATAVLLIALGSDYNVFAVGTIWQEAKHRPLREALAVALPQSSRAITAAGLILAATFATIAIIPLETFREVAFTMAVGLMIDTLIVRPVLTPAALTLLGRAASWPGRRIQTQRPSVSR